MSKPVSTDGRAVCICVLLLSVVLLPGAVVRGDELGDAAIPGRPAIVPDAPHLFGDTQLPYEGHGTVAVVNDGVVMVTIGGRPLSKDEREEHGAWYTAEENFALRVDPAQATVAKANGEWSLCNKTQATQGETIDFDEAFVPDEGESRYAVLQVEGTMRIAMDASTGIYTLQVTNEDVSETFLSTFGVSQAGFPSWSQSAAEATQSSSCQADCDKGDCEITCEYPKAAYCLCIDSYPSCACIDRIKQIVLID